MTPRAQDAKGLMAGVTALEAPQYALMGLQAHHQGMHRDRRGRKEPSYDGDARSPEYDCTTIMPPAAASPRTPEPASLRKWGGHKATDPAAASPHPPLLVNLLLAPVAG
jgi:hypothetical protein